MPDFRKHERYEKYPVPLNIGAEDIGELIASRYALSQEDLLEKSMATHSSILAWSIPWTEEALGLQSMGLQKVGHD